MLDYASPGTPYINAGEEEQPYYVDEMPVPRRKFKTQVLFSRKLPGKSTQKANSEKNRSDDDVEAMETRRHEKGRAVDRAFEGEWRMGIFIGLNPGESGAKQDSQDKPCLQTKTIIVQEGMMGPGHGRAGGQKNKRVEKGKVPWVEGFDALGRPIPPVNSALVYSLTKPGNRLASKNAQNQATKNITSEAMNRIMP